MMMNRERKPTTLRYGGAQADGVECEIRQISPDIFEINERREEGYLVRNRGRERAVSKVIWRVAT